MNCANSKATRFYRLSLELSDRLKVINILLYQILATTTHRIIQKSHTRIINLKY